MEIDETLNSFLEKIKSEEDTRDFAFEKGFILYKERKYFEAHEIWEFQWKKETGSIKLYLQTMIQLSVCLNKIYNEPNLKGAHSLALKARHKLINLLNGNELTETGRTIIFTLQGKINIIINYLKQNKAFDISPPDLEINWREIFK